MKPLHERELIRRQIEKLKFAEKTLKPGEIFDLMDLINPIEQKINKQVSLLNK
jgi:hypothetical protein